MKNAIFWDVTLCGSLRTDVLLKQWFLQEPHDVTSQKTVFFIVTAMRTSNLTKSVVIMIYPETFQIHIAILSIHGLEN
jgi:hypothetical protein